MKAQEFNTRSNTKTKQFKNKNETGSKHLHSVYNLKFEKIHCIY